MITVFTSKNYFCVILHAVFLSFSCPATKDNLPRFRSPKCVLFLGPVLCIVFNMLRYLIYFGSGVREWGVTCITLSAPMAKTFYTSLLTIGECV